MLTVELKSKDKMPLYEQLYLKIRGLITEGELSEGEKLPSERGLAANLQISRNTVTLAYEQLSLHSEKGEKSYSYSGSGLTLSFFISVNSSFFSLFILSILFT